MTENLDEHKAGAAAVDPDDFNILIDAVVALQGGNGGSQATGQILLKTGILIGAGDPGAGPTKIAVLPDGSKAYVPVAGDGINPSYCAVIDLVVGTQVTTVNVGVYPYAIATAPDGSIVYVVCLDGKVYPIDPSDDSVGDPIDVSGSTSGSTAFIDVVFTPDSAKAYVSTWDVNAVVPIDVDTATAGTPIDLTKRTTGLAMSPDGTKIYVACGSVGTDTVVPITVANDTPGTPIGGAFSAPWGIAVTPDGTRLYVCNNGDYTLGVQQVTLPSTVGDPIRLFAADDPVFIAISADSRWAVVTGENEGLTLIDLDTNTPSPLAFLGADSNCQGVAITPDGYVYAADLGEANVAQLVRVGYGLLSA